MHLLQYIEIENFKLFGDKVRVDLSHPTVLIGPNNAGKTTIIQALALWSRGLQTWREKKLKPRKTKLEKLSAGINRLNCFEIPVGDARFLWKGTKVRIANIPIELKINVGVEHQGKVKDCRLIFTWRDSEIIYCHPCEATIEQEDLIEFAADLKCHLLYPMSGIEIGEILLPEGRINVLMGQGQTAQVLRNLCYQLNEQRREKWPIIQEFLKKIFHIESFKLSYNEKLGSIQLTYREIGADNNLDISMAGRGLQQMLLILVWLYLHEKSILLIDEPDAHLEVLRQRQIFEILKDVAEENGSQVIIATHSEVILEIAAETNLTLLINGRPVDIATQTDMKNALRTYGVEHYCNAKTLPRYLYVEGNTDVEMLKALAEKLNHPAASILSDRVNTYFTQNISPDDSLANRLDRAAGAYINFRNHFYTLKRFVPELKGLGIFDKDNKDRRDESEGGLAIVYWERYELENYFAFPEIIAEYMVHHYAPDGEDLLTGGHLKDIQEIVDRVLVEIVFQNDTSQLKEYHAASTNLRRTILHNYKMSEIAERIFELYAQKIGQPILLRKAQYSELIKFCDVGDFPKEITDKLDLICDCLSFE